eukprot:14408726-Heterocapsa_arctica.AAC.1
MPLLGGKVLALLVFLPAIALLPLRLTNVPSGNYPPGVRIPHVTKVVRLPDGGKTIRFPMKDAWTRIHLSIEGKRESPNDVELKEFDPNVIFGCPPEYVEHQEVEAPVIVGDPRLSSVHPPALMGE